MNASVVVVPRERLRQSSQSLRSLFNTIDADVPVIVVVGGAPARLRDELIALRAERPFELIESDGFVLPNRARNIALERVKTRYVAFCDNDIEYTPGWLDALLENAAVNGSAAVSPVILIGPSNPPLVHHAGGSFVARRDDVSRANLFDFHHYENTPLPEAEADRFGQATLDHKYFEYHCVLIDAEKLRTIGGHDERLILHEHLDSSLRLMSAGGRLTFERKSLVMYRAFEKFEDEDWPYFLYRWALHRAELSDRVFAQNWGVHKNGVAWLHVHRARAMFTILPRLPVQLRRRKIRRALLLFYRPRILGLDRKQPDDAAPFVPPPPPVDGLKKAGIPLT